MGCKKSKFVDNIKITRIDDSIKKEYPKLRDVQSSSFETLYTIKSDISASIYSY
tara:strand:- start:9560 stop:9721 length:162 start_codon:yes stop_codon:yes gene_type:complete